MAHREGSGRKTHKKVEDVGFALDNLGMFLKQYATSLFLSTTFFRLTAMTDQELERTLEAFAQALNAGVSLRSLISDSPIGQAIPPRVRNELRLGLDRGTTLASVFKELHVLTSSELAILEQGEKTGHIVQVLRALRESISRRRKQRRKVLLGLLYPTVLLNAAGCILPFPRAIAGHLTAYLTIALIAPILTSLVLISLLIVLPRLHPEHPLRTLPYRLALRTPILGKALQRGTHSTFAHALGLALDAGLSLQIALPTAIVASNNPTLIAQEPLILRRLNAGRPLHETLAVHTTFHPSFLPAVALAEASGSLPDTLQTLAHNERVAQKRTVGMLTAALIAVTALAVLCAVVYGIIGGFQTYLNTIERLTPKPIP